MESMDEGNLEDLLMVRRNLEISWALRLKVYTEVAAGLRYLHHDNHNKVYVHGDLKPQNVLLTKDFEAKIADFGSTNIAVAIGATSISLELPDSKQCTEFYADPEFLNDPGKPRTPSEDVYSFGLIGYEVITREHVFSSSNPPQPNPNIIIELIKCNGLKPDPKFVERMAESIAQGEDQEIFKLLKSVMEDCWVRRPDINEIFECLAEKYKQMDTSKISADVEALKMTRVDPDSEKSTEKEYLSKCQRVSLVEFYHPFNSIQPPPISDTDALDDLHEVIFTHVQVTEASLENEDFKTAETELEKLLSVSINRELEPRFHELRRRILKIAKFIYKQSHAPVFALLMMWTIEFCGHFSNPDEKLEKMRGCGHVIFEVALSMWKNEHRVEIEHHILPLLKVLLQKVEAETKGGIKQRYYTISWCKYFIGWCHQRLGSYRLAEAFAKSAIALMEEIYVNQATRYALVSYCYCLQSQARERLCDDSNAKRLREKTKRALQKVDGVTDIEKRKCLACMKNKNRRCKFFVCQ
ncbi:unnamed protein product [Clavelina lepadiformis]